MEWWDVNHLRVPQQIEENPDGDNDADEFEEEVLRVNMHALDHISIHARTCVHGSVFLFLMVYGNLLSVYANVCL